MKEEDGVSKSTLALVAIGAVIATVVVLELAGKIRHNTDKDMFPIADYRVVLLQPGEEHRISAKPAQQHAYCHQGFVFIQSETDPQLRGPLVDFRNRGIPCHPGEMPAQPEARPEHTSEAP